MKYEIEVEASDWIRIRIWVWIHPSAVHARGLKAEGWSMFHPHSDTPLALIFIVDHLCDRFSWVQARPHSIRMEVIRRQSTGKKDRQPVWTIKSKLQRCSQSVQSSIGRIYPQPKIRFFVVVRYKHSTIINKHATITSSTPVSTCPTILNSSSSGHSRHIFNSLINRHQHHAHRPHPPHQIIRLSRPIKLPLFSQH